MTEQEHSYYQTALEIPVDHPVDRIVSLVPSMTESLFDLNLGNRVVGITDYCVHPAGQLAGLPRIGGTKNPDVQQIIDLNPGLVIANWEENRKEDVEALKSAGIPVWVTFPTTIEEVFNILWNIMYFFEETSMVPRVRLIEYTYDRMLNIAEQHEENPCRVFVPIWVEPLMTFNANTYIHDVLKVCGGQNVFAERERAYPLSADLGLKPPIPVDDPIIADRDTRYPRVTLEEVEQAQPDVILLPSEPFAFTEEHISLFSNLKVPAAEHNRIRLVDGSLLSWHGTRVAYAFNEIPRLLCE